MAFSFAVHCSTISIETIIISEVNMYHFHLKEGIQYLCEIKKKQTFSPADKIKNHKINFSSEVQHPDET